MRRLHLGCALLLALLSGACIGCSSSGTTPAVCCANAPMPRGEWEAVGTVAASDGYINEPTGTILNRPWWFRKICASSCRIEFVRGTLSGLSKTILKRHRGYYSAAFPPVKVPCPYPAGSSPRSFGFDHDSYVLRWTSDRHEIHAMEHSEGGGECGPGSARQTVEWVATLAAPGSGG